MTETEDSPEERRYVELRPLSPAETLTSFNSGNQDAIVYALWSTAQFADDKIGQDWALHFLNSADEYLAEVSVNILEFLARPITDLEYRRILSCLKRRAYLPETSLTLSAYIHSMAHDITKNVQWRRQYRKKLRHSPGAADDQFKHLRQAGLRGQRRAFKRPMRRPRSRA